MKKTYQAVLIFLLVLQSPLLAQPISDIPKSNGAYKSIKKAVDHGYLSLFNNKEFKGSRSINRKEMALILNKLETKINKSELKLSHSEVKELENLSKTFKNNLTDIENSLKLSQKKTILIENEQKVLNHDLSKINDELLHKNKELLTEVKTFKQKQDLNMWIAIGGCIMGALGLIVK